MYRVIDESGSENLFNDLSKVVRRYYTEDDFDKFLDETNEPIELFGTSYAFSDVFGSTDPFEWEEMYYEMRASIEEELREELKQDGSAYFYNGAHIFDLDKWRDE